MISKDDIRYKKGLSNLQALYHKYFFLQIEINSKKWIVNGK